GRQSVPEALRNWRSPISKCPGNMNLGGQLERPDLSCFIQAGRVGTCHSTLAIPLELLQPMVQSIIVRVGVVCRMLRFDCTILFRTLVLLVTNHGRCLERDPKVCALCSIVSDPG